MTPKQYVEDALRTEARDMTPVLERVQDPQLVRLMHAMIGMCTEAGEVQDAVKKHVFYGKELDRPNLIEELGDIMWYIAIATDVLDTTLEEVMQKNSDKLRARYGNKFTEETAITRNLDKEREILEG